MQINVYYSRGAWIHEKDSSSTCIKRREAAFLKLLAYMNSELKKSSTKFVDNNKIYTNFSQKRSLRSLLLIHTHGAVKPSKHMLLGMGFKSYWFKESSRNY